MAEAFLRRLSRWQAEDERTALADLRTVACRDAAGEGAPDREEFLCRFADHVQQPHFDMVVAADPALVGYAYGFHADRDSGWWDGFERVPAEIAELSPSWQVFHLAELVVLPAHRRRHVGGRLHDHLLSRSAAPAALILLAPGNLPARAALQAWGWSKTAALWPREAAAPLEAWSRPLSR